MKRIAYDPVSVRDLVMKGMTDKAIAAVIGCHHSSIYRIRQLHGIESAHPKAEKISPYAVMKLKAMGLSNNEIADELACTRQGVWRISAEYGV